MTPKITLAMPSIAATARSRIRVDRKLIEQAVRIASTSTCSTSLSTNGCRKLVGKQLVLQERGEALVALPVATDLFACSIAAAEGCPWKPAPGCTRLPASRPMNRAITLATRK